MVVLPQSTSLWCCVPPHHRLLARAHAQVRGGEDGEAHGLGVSLGFYGSVVTMSLIPHTQWDYYHRRKHCVSAHRVDMGRSALPLEFGSRPRTSRCRWRWSCYVLRVREDMVRSYGTSSSSWLFADAEQCSQVPSYLFTSRVTLSGQVLCTWRF